MALLLYRNMNCLKLKKLNRNRSSSAPIRSSSYNPADIVSTFLSSSKLFWRPTSSRKTHIKCLFMHSFRIVTAGKKKQKLQPANPAWNTDTVLGGFIWARSAEAVQARSEINHPIPTLHPDSCFQWIVAWYSWYLRAVPNRIGFQLASTELD